MPTHGGFPPKVFYEILTRMGNLSGKQAIIFTTARLTCGKTRDYMKVKVEGAGALIVASIKFRGFFRLGIKNAIKFGKEVNGKSYQLV